MQEVRMMHNRLWTILGLHLVSLAICCSGSEGEPVNLRSQKTLEAGSRDPSPVSDASGEEKQAVTKVVNRTFDSSGAGIQVKDVMLLRSSIESCMGPGMLSVSEDMLMPIDLTATLPALGEGRVRFLLPNRYRVSDDIIEKEKSNLLELNGGVRTNTANDALTDTYLRAVETVSNVIAHNCSLANPSCQCATPDKALAMLSRCLPGLNPGTVEMADTAGLLAVVCADGGASGMRKAIASLVSSYAFIVAR